MFHEGKENVCQCFMKVAFELAMAQELAAGLGGVQEREIMGSLTGSSAMPGLQPWADGLAECIDALQVETPKRWRRLHDSTCKKPGYYPRLMTCLHLIATSVEPQTTSDFFFL